MIVLTNGNTEARFSPVGAEPKSLTVNGNEFLWNSDPRIWAGCCPLLFPVCGGLLNDKYRWDGIEYPMEKHGFARRKTFTVTEQTQTSVSFLLTDSEETRKIYPFAFALSVNYTLEPNRLNAEYRILNKGATPMCFAIGSHEGYATPEGIEDYDVIFPEKETLRARLTDGGILSDQYLPLLKDGNVLPLYDKYFTVDALVFESIKSRSATLRNRKTGRAVQVDFPNAKHLVLWHKHGAGFFCVEPWSAVHDDRHVDGDLRKKPDVTLLQPGTEARFFHAITVTE